MATRYFYKDPLKAAWMVRAFDIEVIFLNKRLYDWEQVAGNLEEGNKKTEES